MFVGRFILKPAGPGTSLFAPVGPRGPGSEACLQPLLPASARGAKVRLSSRSGARGLTDCGQTLWKWRSPRCPVRPFSIGRRRRRVKDGWVECHSKVIMSGPCKVELSSFEGACGRGQDGVTHEPEGTGSVKGNGSAGRGPSEAGRGGAAVAAERASGSSDPESVGSASGNWSRWTRACTPGSRAGPRPSRCS